MEWFWADNDKTFYTKRQGEEKRLVGRCYERHPHSCLVEMDFCKLGLKKILSPKIRSVGHDDDLSRLHRTSLEARKSIFALVQYRSRKPGRMYKDVVEQKTYKSGTGRSKPCLPAYWRCNCKPVWQAMKTQLRLLLLLPQNVRPLTPALFNLHIVFRPYAMFSTYFPLRCFC